MWKTLRPDRLQVPQNFFGMVTRRDLRVDPTHDSRRVDEEAHPSRESEKTPNAVFAQDRPAPVAQHRKPETVTLDESLLGRQLVSADPDHLHVLALVAC